MTQGPGRAGGVRIDRWLTIPDGELELRFSTSGGPGGQHANKASTRVEVVWDVSRSRVLSPPRRERLERRLRNRIDSAGRLRIVSDAYRSQMRNRADALDRLAEIVASALTPEKPRRPTKPTNAARERRLTDKRRHAQLKSLRRTPPGE
jgi:ribosome-associated protein